MAKGCLLSRLYFHRRSEKISTITKSNQPIATMPAKATFLPDVLGQGALRRDVLFLHAKPQVKGCRVVLSIRHKSSSGILCVKSTGCCNTCEL